jgi:hypothetical protein
VPMGDTRKDPNRRRLPVPVVDLRTYDHYRLTPNETTRVRVVMPDSEGDPIPELLIIPNELASAGVAVERIIDEASHVELTVEPVPVTIGLQLRIVDAPIARMGILIDFVNPSSEPLTLRVAMIASVVRPAPDPNFDLRRARAVTDIRAAIAAKRLTAGSLLQPQRVPYKAERFAISNEHVVMFDGSVPPLDWSSVAGVSSADVDDIRAVVDQPRERFEQCRKRFGEESVGPGEAVTFIWEPGKPWRLEKLGIDRRSGPHFFVRHIRVGVVDQLMSETPAACFQGLSSADTGMIFDTCGPGLQISTEIVNTSNEPRALAGWWQGYGPGALSIPDVEHVPRSVMCPMQIMVGRLEPGEHKRLEIVVEPAAPDGAPMPATENGCPTRILIPPALYDLGARLVVAEINGERIAHSTDVDEETETDNPWRIMLAGRELDAGDRLALTFANLGTGDRPGPIDLRAVLAWTVEYIPGKVSVSVTDE